MKKLGLVGLVLVVAMGAGVALSVFGYFQVEPDQQAVILRLGRYQRTVGPGPHFRWLGIEKVEMRRVTASRELEFGYRTLDSGPPAVFEDRPHERRMLTGDENIVNLEFALQYRIAALREYLFNVEDPENAIRDVAQAAMRAVVADRPIDDVLTTDKAAIEKEAKDLTQLRLDAYGAGIEIQGIQLQDVEAPDAVKEAFAEVVNAKQDRQRAILDATGYAEKVVPEARGEAEEMLNQARAYSASRILRARGDAKRFSELLGAYRKARQVTRTRLYLETLEEILPGMEKVIVEEGTTGDVLPYLPVGRKAAPQ